ncbi:MAG: LamG domain-containing protein [Fidelibacterota bacterium]|nr:MAG: LamG domain-containing protein [Candidatus Neomarinimicrobiota bacterium]
MQETIFYWQGGSTEGIYSGECETLGSPGEVESPSGMALEFDGRHDGILLGINPLAGLEQFTVEVLFCPYPAGHHEQRFLHMGECHDDRMLFETRVVDNNSWYLDTYLSVGGRDKTMMNKGFEHPLGQWYHAALTCDGSQLTNFVDGSPELSCAFEFIPLTGGQTSIGMRQNRVSWFKGAISTIRVAPVILAPKEFLTSRL